MEDLIKILKETYTPKVENTFYNKIIIKKAGLLTRFGLWGVLFLKKRLFTSF